MSDAELAERFRAWVREMTTAQDGTPVNGAAATAGMRAVAAALEAGESPSSAAAQMVRVLEDPAWGFERYVRVRDVVLAVQGERAALADRWELLRQLGEADPELMKELERFPGADLTDPWEDARRRQQDALRRSDDLVDRDVLEADEAWDGDEPDE